MHSYTGRGSRQQKWQLSIKYTPYDSLEQDEYRAENISHFLLHSAEKFQFQNINYNIRSNAYESELFLCNRHAVVAWVCVCMWRVCCMCGEPVLLHRFSGERVSWKENLHYIQHFMQRAQSSTYEIVSIIYNNAMKISVVAPHTRTTHTYARNLLEPHTYTSSRQKHPTVFIISGGVSTKERERKE